MRISVVIRRACELEHLQRDAQPLGAGLHRLELARSGGVREHGDSLGSGQQLFQQLEALPRQLCLLLGYSSDSASRTRQAGDMASGHGVIVDRHHDYGRVPARLLDRGQICLGAGREEDVAVLPRKVGGQLGQAFNSPLRGAELDHEIASLDEPEFAQPLHEGDVVGLRALRCGEPADPIGPLGLLGNRQSGPGQHAAQRREEGSSSAHSDARFVLVAAFVAVPLTIAAPTLPTCQQCCELDLS